jgi:hypothetical protein
MKSVGGHCKAFESSKTSNPYFSTSVKSYRSAAALNVNAAVLNAIDVLNLTELILDGFG